MTVGEALLLAGMVTTSLLAIIGAIFSGMVALRQMPRQDRELAKVHSLVNGTSVAAQEEITQLRAEIRRLRRELKKEVRGNDSTGARSEDDDPSLGTRPGTRAPRF